MSGLFEILPKLRDCLSSVPELVLAYVFGSRAKSDAGPLSDLDIAVVMDQSVPPSQYLVRQLDLDARLRTLLGVAADVVILNEATPLLAHRVISHGRLVLCRDEAFRVRFEAQRISEYLDTRCLDEEYDRVLAKRVREGRLIG